MVRRRKKKTAKRFMISMISVISILTGTILILESVTGWRIKDLTEELKANTVNTVMNIEEAGAMNRVMDFSVKLLKNSVSESENILISPLSSLGALAMVAVGAEENTKTQLEGVIGFTVEELNDYVHLYRSGLSEAENGSLKMNNSVWLNEAKELNINQSFLQTITDYYEAPVYQVTFDNKARNEINLRISEETNDTIKDALPLLSEDAVMFLINTIAFECEWSEPLRESQIQDGTFTTEQGIKRKAYMMRNEEFHYLHDEKASGVMKHYDEYRYVFVALLPNEGISMAEYISTLTGAEILQIMSQVESRSVIMELPRFELHTSTELKNTLETMGVTEAFDPLLADFSGIGTLELNNIYIETIVQKTYIDVNEHGTRAGAATVVEIPESLALVEEEEEPIYITFDRPFLYMILDSRTNMPVMMGTVMDIGH